MKQVNNVQMQQGSFENHSTEGRIQQDTVHSTIAVINKDTKKQKQRVKIKDRILKVLLVICVIAIVVMARQLWKQLFVVDKNMVPQQLSIKNPYDIGQNIVPQQLSIKTPQQINKDISVVDASHIPSWANIHPPRTFKYPTIGIPQPGKTYNDRRVHTQEMVMFDEQIYKLFQPYNDTDCQFIRMGDQSNPDGGYVFCNNFINQSEGLINIGINGIDNFGCQLTTANSKMTNYQYDCTNPTQPACYTNGNRNKFILACVGSVTEQAQRFKFYTLEDMLTIHELKRKHIFLKIDSEGGQYPAFKYFPVEYLDYVDQIVGQFHFDFIYPDEWGMLDIFRTLTDKFVVVNLHMNDWGCMSYSHRKLKSRAVEVSLVNRKLIKLNSESRSFQQNPLNKPNGGRYDCQYLGP